MKDLTKLMHVQFEKMCKTGKLFRSSLSGNEIWNLYLNSFEVNPIFRDPESSTHNCNHCKNFIRRYGNIVALDENFNIMSIWDVIPNDLIINYIPSCNAVSNALKVAPIQNIFTETFSELNSLPYQSINKNTELFQLGTAVNGKHYTQAEVDKFKVVNTNDIYTFNHLHLFLPKQYVSMNGDSEASIMAEYRSAKDVFMRSMEELNADTLKLVRDLINQGSLLDGKTHLYKVIEFIPYLEQYSKLADDKKDNWCWATSYKLPFAKFKNELIGVLCTDLAEGKELNNACKLWNIRVDPKNYMKAVAPITARQIEEAEKFVEENNYTESFDRRYATPEDIKVSEILHVNAGDGKIKKVSLFDGVKSTSTRHKRSEFDGIENIHIDKFMKDILPTCTSVEVFLQNKHEGNLVSLTTANVKESKPIFKWNNNYSWTFNGNLAGKSQIKEAVKSRGGNVDAVVAIRLHFPDTENDYDLYVTEPNGNIIYYSNKRIKQSSSGMLDLDAQGLDGRFPPEKRVENTTYTDKIKMPNGNYKIQVNNHPSKRLDVTFYMDIEIEGDITQLKLKTLGLVKPTAAVINKKDGEFTLSIDPCMEVIDSRMVSKELYGLESEQFHKVNLVCLTPNHWDDNEVGNKHYLFMLEGAKNPDPIRSFHAENLIPELANHRKVLEVLGEKTMIAPTDKQLSGVGFNATVEDEVILKLGGSFKRVIKVHFKS